MKHLFLIAVLSLTACASVPKQEPVEEKRGPASAGPKEEEKKEEEKRLAKEEDREGAEPSALPQAVETKPICEVNPFDALVDLHDPGVLAEVARSEYDIYNAFREDIIRQCMNTGCGLTLPSFFDLRQRTAP